jgi:hypothetical protein
MSATKTIDEAKDQILGKVGTKRRDNYEKELKKELSNKAACNEHPIPFSTPMVQANLEGRKTMTRIIINTEKFGWDCHSMDFDHEQYHPKLGLQAYFFDGTSLLGVKCPYGHRDDLLWVRESFAEKLAVYKYKADFKDQDSSFNHPWKPSRYMPKAAARIWQQITEIRVERLQNISEEDAKAEGVEPLINTFPGIDNFKYIKTPNYRTGFMKTWIKINGEESWNSNPWVWVVKYKVLSTTGRPENV